MPCGRLGGRLCLVGLFSRVGLACLVIGVGNTPAVVGCCGLVVVVVCWWWVPLRVWGWHAVGVLGQCALVAWPVRGLLVSLWGFLVGVGGLVVNCIVDASILL